MEWNQAEAIAEAHEAHNRLVAKHSPPHEPLTAAELLDALQKLLKNYPEWADRYVHILNMNDDDEDDITHGLVTHLETDCITDEQGLVVSLMAWRDMPPPNYQAPFCPECRGAVPQYHSRSCSIGAKYNAKT